MSLLELIFDDAQSTAAREQLVGLLTKFAKGLTAVDLDRVADSIIQGRFQNMQEKDILDMAYLNAKPLNKDHYHYSYFCARILIQETVMKDVRDILNLPNAPDSELLVPGLRHGRRCGMIDERLLDGRFDLEWLAAALKPKRNELLTVLAAQTLYDRYLQHDGGVRYETIQTMFMRIAMGLAIDEDNPTQRALEFYELLSCFDYMSSTPTLFNAGTKRPQLSSCYLTTIQDDLYNIYGGIRNNAMLSKWSGGIGNDWSRVRALNAHIKGTNGKSQGTVPFLKVNNDTAVAVNQGGKRKGAFCAYLTTWHLDIEEFLELRKNTGDDRRRTHDMNTANWIPDLFMQRMLLDQDWTLFSPNEVPELNETYGAEFEKHYTYYEENAKALNLLHKRVKAKDLWRKMLTMLFETGHPWVTFKDPCNIRSPQSHVGIVRSSNLCCIAADQRVVTDEGIVTIAELYSNQRKPVIAGRGHTAQASEMLLPRPNAPMVNICTKEGYSHKVTPDHRVWVVGKGIVEAQHLVAGDHIELQWTSLFGIVDKPMLAYISGLLAGDGTFTESGVRLDFWEGKSRHLAYDALMRTLDVLNLTDVDLGKRANFDITLNSNELKDFFHSASLAKVMADEGLTKDTKLQVPEFVWKGNSETVASYIRGLFLTDGTISSSGGVTTASLSSTSQKLLNDLQILLLNFGIRSTVSMMKPAGTNTLPDGNGGNAEYNCKAVYRLMVTSIQGCKLLEEITSIGYHRNNAKYLSNLTKDGYKQKLHATFSHLEELPNEDAYCLTVESEDHAWTVNGFITHNTEITLNTSDDEIAVCNLGSVNLVNHIVDGVLDAEKLERTIKTAIRMLDNVISINYYPVEEAENSNLKHRPIGLGIMGFQDALYKLGYSYASQAAVNFADESMELISYYAIKASANLARERGSYPTFEGSTWSKGQVPLDTLDALIASRPQGMIEVDTSSRLGKERWDEIRELVRGGMRNSNVMAIAPTATISNICGVSQSIEPTFQNLFVKSNLSGEFTVNNPYLVDKLIELGLWDLSMSKAILNAEGSIQKIPNIPSDVKEMFLTAFEVEPRWIVDAASRRQKWIDQAQSLNLYIANANGKKLDLTYKMAWLRGLKTTYYLRAIGATSAEKSTGDTHLNAVSATIPEFSVAAPVPGACSISDPSCEACQ